MFQILKREIYVAKHAQTTKFRIAKYIVILIIGTTTYKLFGANSLISLLIFASILSIFIHLFFRWKTDSWKKSWGPYNKIPIPSE